MKSSFFPLMALIAVTSMTGCKQPAGEKSATMEQKLSGKIAGSVTIEGAYALYPLMIRWAEAFQLVYPDVKVIVNKPVTHADLKEHFNSGVDLVMLSRELTLEEDTTYWSLNVAKLGVIPIINKKNPHIEKIVQNGITHDKLCLVFTSDKPLTWGDILATDAGEILHIYYREKTSGACRIWAHFLFQEPENLRGEEIVGDDALVAKIQNDPLGLGFCNIIFAFDPITQKPLPDIQPLPIDFDRSGRIDYKEQVYEDLKEYQRAVCIGKYPHTLCRYLIMVSEGKPGDPAMRVFLNWIVNEGQEIAFNAGYSPLHGKAAECAKQCLKD
ncbi:MAG TPA: substrate-binding domain-containing protein [Bacteroidales bacterium]|nr:substrate-binding domain-containing protein [Bacteroidales bacterium]